MHAFHHYYIALSADSSSKRVLGLGLRVKQVVPMLIQVECHKTYGGVEV
jgi:hypothetical protein